MLINASIEVRMTSTRLPGKVLMPIVGKPVLELLVERVKRVKYIDNIIIATTTNSEDDPVQEVSEKLGVKYYRGSEHDVLGRVYETHREFESDLVVELTGDNPLIDPSLIDYCILSYLYSDCDYVSTALSNFFPKGQAIQVFSFELLSYLNKNANRELDREHVTPHIYQNEEKYDILSLKGSREHFAPQQRQTLDTKEDYEEIKYVFERLYSKNKEFDLSDVINVIKERE